MPSNDREVWVSITSEHGSAVINYIAYALYSFEKYEWYHQIEKQKGQPPTAADTNDWISQITEVRMKTWQEGAARMFDVSARDYMDNRINTARQEAINHQVVISVRSSLDRYNEQFNECLKNVQKSSSFRNQLFVAFLTAILSPIILGVILLAVQAADLWPTASGVTTLLHPKPAETSPAHN